MTTAVIGVDAEQELMNHLAIGDSLAYVVEAGLARELLLRPQSQDALAFARQYWSVEGNAPSREVLGTEFPDLVFYPPSREVGWVVGELKMRFQRNRVTDLLCGVAEMLHEDVEAAIDRLRSGVKEIDSIAPGTSRRPVSYKLNELPEPQDPEWIMWPLVEESSYGLFIGSPKVGKTTLLGAGVAAVINGTDFFGRQTRQMPVVYLSEQDKRHFSRQMHPACLMRPESFEVIPYGDNNWMTWSQFLEFGRERCRELGSRLLIVDTAGRFTNSFLHGDRANSDGYVRTCLDEIHRCKADGIAVILAIHEGKGAGRDTDITRAHLGSTAWAAEADIIVRSQQLEELGSTQRRLTVTGRLPEEEIDKYTVAYIPERGDFELLGTFDDVVRAVEDEQYLAILPTNNEEAIGVEEIAERVNATLPESHPQVSKERARTVMKRLFEEKLVQKTQGESTGGRRPDLFWRMQLESP